MCHTPFDAELDALSEKKYNRESWGPKEKLFSKNGGVTPRNHQNLSYLLPGLS